MARRQRIPRPLAPADLAVAVQDVRNAEVARSPLRTIAAVSLVVSYLRHQAVASKDQNLANLGRHFHACLFGACGAPSCSQIS